MSLDPRQTDDQDPDPEAVRAEPPAAAEPTDPSMRLALDLLAADWSYGARAEWLWMRSMPTPERVRHLRSV